MKCLIYRETCAALGLDPLPDGAPARRVEWFDSQRTALDAPMEIVDMAGYEPEPLPLERVAELFNVPPEIVAAIPRGYTAALNTERITHRRPWVPESSLDATQQIPVVRVDPC